MYLYSILLEKHFLFLYYSDLSRNYLNGTIPKQWGSMMNISKMYDFSFILIFYCFNQSLFDGYYTRSIV